MNPEELFPGQKATVTFYGLDDAPAIVIKHSQLLGGKGLLEPKGNLLEFIPNEGNTTYVISAIFIAVDGKEYGTQVSIRTNAKPDKVFPILPQNTVLPGDTIDLKYELADKAGNKIGNVPDGYIKDVRFMTNNPSDRVSGDNTKLSIGTPGTRQVIVRLVLEDNTELVGFVDLTVTDPSASAPDRVTLVIPNNRATVGDTLPLNYQVTDGTGKVFQLKPANVEYISDARFPDDVITDGKITFGGEAGQRKLVVSVLLSDGKRLNAFALVDVTKTVAEKSYEVKPVLSSSTAIVGDTIDLDYLLTDEDGKKVPTSEVDDAKYTTDFDSDKVEGTKLTVAKAGTHKVSVTVILKDGSTLTGGPVDLVVTDPATVNPSNPPEGGAEGTTVTKPNMKDPGADPGAKGQLPFTGTQINGSVGAALLLTLAGGCALILRRRMQMSR